MPTGGEDMSVHVSVVFVIVTVWNIAATDGATAEGAIRLVNGQNSSEGRVEIYLQGQWGTICDDLWDIREATVVCKQLGFLDAISAVGSAEFGEGSGPIQLDDLHCVGNEIALTNCLARPIKEHNCIHFEDAGVRCNPCPLHRQIRLVDGTVTNEGRVEVRNGCYGDWGTVCDDHWDNADAQTTCRQLGYISTVGAIAHSSASFGQGTGKILLDDLKCSGTENSLFECPHDRSTIDCRHYEDAGASCPSCYKTVTRITTFTRQRYVQYLYYTRTGWWIFRRNKSAYRSRLVTYYDTRTVYYNQVVPCPVDGGWGPYICGRCSVTCDKGRLTCTRECNNPSPANRGNNCVGPFSRVHPCDEGCCPVDGGWSSWTCGSCSKTCGAGIRSCTRRCNNPTPSCGGNECLGSDTDRRSCLINNPVNGGWSSWAYGSCSRSCGGGTRRLTRRCNKPTPFCGGSYCPGSSTSTSSVFCNTNCCPVNGGWSLWSCESCSRTCGGGVRRCTRVCNDPAPYCEGSNCLGLNDTRSTCNTNCCPVDGGWSTWTQGSCSKTCGGGIRRYTRSCNNPTPSCGGLSCRGNSTREEACNEFCCSVDGGWSSWKPGPCSKTCGGGIRNDTRTCNNPTPSCGGLSCTGISTREEACNEICCPVDGGWSSWTQGSCSKTCGGGIKKFTRSCNNPTPSCGGLSCAGNSTREEACNKFCCRVNGRWSSWKPGGKCSKTCGGGILKFVRTCNNPAPSCGGIRCRGISIFEVACNTFCCRVDGGWSNWSAGNCSRLCDHGTKEKTRSCSNPAPSCGGNNCIGETVETVECNTFHCIGPWSNWNECSVGCGNGTKHRTRTCITHCENGTIQYKDCNMGCCPVDGGWSSWYNQTECSVSCGGGVLTQWRNCTQPSPSCNGSDCQGEMLIPFTVILIAVQLMAVGQTGQLKIVQSCVMVEIKQKPELVVILHHLVGEAIVLAKQ